MELNTNDVPNTNIVSDVSSPLARQFKWSRE